MMKNICTKERLFNNRALLALILPIFGEQLLSILVGLMDSIMAAYVGEAAVSGVSLVDNVNVLVIYIFSASATAGAVIAGQYLGKKKQKEAGQSATQLIWFSAMTGLVMTVVVLILKKFILNFVFGKIEPEVMKNAEIYLVIVAFSFPFIAVYYAGAAIFRTMGDSKTSMYASIFMNLINVGGNAFCIYGLKTGVEGVAIPTLVSRILSAILLVYLLQCSDGMISVKGSLRYRPDFWMIKNILRLSIPNAVENGVFQMGKIVMLSLVSSFGTYAIAANAVCNSMATLMLVPGMAINLAVIPVISRCVGAGDEEQIHYYAKKLILATHISFIISNLLVLISMPWVLDIYNISAEAIEASRKILTMYALFNITVWPISFMLPNVFRAAGDVSYSMVVTLISMWIFRVGTSFLFANVFGMGVIGVWASYVVDWSFRGICFVQHYIRGKWKGRTVI